MLYKFVFNILFVIMIGICGYYTTLYSRLNENIENIANIVEKSCGRSMLIMEENTA